MAGATADLTGTWSGEGGQVTVLVPTSAVPTNPGTEHIEAALASIAAHPLLAAARKLLIFDALPDAHERERFGNPKWHAFWSDPDGYQRYREAVTSLCDAQRPPFVNARCLLMPRFSHLSGGLAAALEHVTTPHVLVVQHDLALRSPASQPVEGILRALELSGNVRCVFLNRWRNDDVSSRNWFRFRPDVRLDCAWDAALPRLTAVHGFSDQVHFATAAHYREVLLPRCPVPDAPEHTLHRLSLTAPHEEFATWVLGGPGDGPYISLRHSARLAGVRAALDRTPRHPEGRPA